MHRTMTRLLAVVFAACIVASVSEAQVAGLDIGVTAGVNFATVAGDRDAQNLTGFMAGVSFIAAMTERFAFQPEIAYSTKGSSGEEDGEEFKVKLAYIDVPLLVKISLGTAMTQARPALYFGPYAAVNVGCDITGGGMSVECNAIGLEPRTVDYGLIGGAGVDFRNFNFFARYQFGLAKLGDEPDAADAKNRVIQVGGRFSFRGR